MVRYPWTWCVRKAPSHLIGQVGRMEWTFGPLLPRELEEIWKMLSRFREVCFCPLDKDDAENAQPQVLTSRAMVLVGERMVQMACFVMTISPQVRKPSSVYCL